MRFEDMKNNIPETPDFIHEMIKNEVDRQLQETKIIAIPKKRKRWNKAIVSLRDDDAERGDAMRFVLT